VHVLRDSGAVTRSESSMFSLCVLCRSSGFSAGVRPIRGLADRFSVSVEAAVRKSGAVVEATRAPLAKAIGRWSDSLEPVRDAP
jgi:hypothetical protein